MVAVSNVYWFVHALGRSLCSTVWCVPLSVYCRVVGLSNNYTSLAYTSSVSDFATTLNFLKRFSAIPQIKFCCFFFFQESCRARNLSDQADPPLFYLVVMLMILFQEKCIIASETDRVPFGWCPRIWDKLLCWPPSPPAEFLVQPCFEELHGIKYDTSRE